MPKFAGNLKMLEHYTELLDYDLSICSLGERAFDSTPKFRSINKENENHFVPEDERILAMIDKTIVDKFVENNIPIPSFEKAGERKKLYFEPGFTVSAIVTCGGLCPGLNSVIRGIVTMNYYRYNNQINYGIKYGYAGFIKDYGYDVQLLTPDTVDGIQTLGGTILGSSRENRISLKLWTG